MKLEMPCHMSCASMDFNITIQFFGQIFRFLCNLDSDFASVTNSTHCIVCLIKIFAGSKEAGTLTISCFYQALQELGCFPYLITLPSGTPLLI